MQTFDIILEIAIGLAVGGILMLDLIIILTCIIWRRSRRRVQDSNIQMEEPLA